MLNENLKIVLETVQGRNDLSPAMKGLVSWAIVDKEDFNAPYVVISSVKAHEIIDTAKQYLVDKEMV